ncbi:Tyrosine-protein kinase Dnt [Chionoecetes opilio]|uniref:Tyrosine-protein kinase Dnt n=1 Tax=Chionoecetes opilio TaxID=41210 RepID=A0A8J5CF11_CHIOP|nr:Tyrosine-protein kinase Dnt [Chionoecetes opilio]
MQHKFPKGFPLAAWARSGDCRDGPTKTCILDASLAAVVMGCNTSTTSMVAAGIGVVKFPQAKNNIRALVTLPNGSYIVADSLALVASCLGASLARNRSAGEDNGNTEEKTATIDSELQVRVCDTALARDLFPQDYHCLGHNQNRPVKWLSLEALIHKQFTPTNDGWMFGVLLWELVTLAQQPYIEVTPSRWRPTCATVYRLAQPQQLS